MSLLIGGLEVGVCMMMGTRSCSRKVDGIGLVQDVMRDHSRSPVTHTHCHRSRVSSHSSVTSSTSEVAHCCSIQPTFTVYYLYLDS